MTDQPRLAALEQELAEVKAERDTARASLESAIATFTSAICLFREAMDERNTLKNRARAAEASVAILTERVRKLEEALTDIAVYGCGMFNQPAAINGPNERWLEKRIARYEQVARAALSPEPKEPSDDPR